MSPSVQPRQVSTGRARRARPVLPSGVLSRPVLSRRLRPGRIAGVGRAARRVIARPSAASPIDAPGTSETAWRAWAELARLPVADIASWTSAVIVAAHPDDEVLGAGGIICQLAAAGARLRVIAVTDGEAAYPDETDFAQRRAQERSAALRALGAGEAEVVRLGLPGSGLAGRERDIAKRIGELVTGFDVCRAPWEKDVHADHEAVGRAARQASGRAGVLLSGVDVALGRPGRLTGAVAPGCAGAAAARGGQPEGGGDQLLPQPAGDHESRGGPGAVRGFCEPFHPRL
jgi:hypothetical protein